MGDGKLAGVCSCLDLPASAKVVVAADARVRSSHSPSRKAHNGLITVASGAKGRREPLCVLGGTPLCLIFCSVHSFLNADETAVQRYLQELVGNDKALLNSCFLVDQLVFQEVCGCSTVFRECLI